MEEYVEIPAEMDTQDIEIRTCDEVSSAGAEDTNTKHFYIVQQTSDGLVIQIAEPNDTGKGPTAHLNRGDATEMVASTIINAGDIAGLVASAVTADTPVTCDADAGSVDVSPYVSTDDVGASDVVADDVMPELAVADSSVGDAHDEDVEGQCDETDDVHSTDYNGDDPVDHAGKTQGDTAADHAYIRDANMSAEPALDVTDKADDPLQVSNGATHDVEPAEVSSNSEAAEPEEPSDSSSNGDTTKATPSRRTSLRTRSRQVTNDTRNASPVSGPEPSNDGAQPKIRTYQRRQRQTLSRDKDKSVADATHEASIVSNEAPVEKNEVSKRAGRRRSFTALVASRKECQARQEDDETLDSRRPAMPVVPRAGEGVQKSVVLTDMAYINNLKAEVDQLQKLNEELKSRMKQMERKSQQHNADRKVLTGGSGDRKVLTGGADRKIGINWKDMKFSVRKSSSTTSPRTTSPKDAAENKAYLKRIDGLASQGRELLHREEMVEKKEQRLKALDMELDRRSSIIKCKEAKLERLESQLKARENALQTREKRLTNREGRGEETGERVAGQSGKEAKMIEREKQLHAKEKELEMKQELLRATERQLTALGQELTDKFHYLQMKQGNRSVPVTMASQKGRQAAGKVAKVAAKRTNHLKVKTVSNVLAANKKNANKEKPSKASSGKPPVPKVILKRQHSANSRQTKNKRRKV